MKPGDLLASKYRLERVLGFGGMGKVWSAVNESTGRPFAIKLMHSLPPEFRTRLLREARAGGTLNHKNVVDIYDVGETESGDPFLVMELLTGETLADCLKRVGPLPPARAVEIALSVAAALRVAHAKGIVHRDLKPANIFLHREADGDVEIVKVLDFGASKHLQEASATTTGSLVGSPAYMSPEQARAEPDIDARSDLWSLGVVLYEMLAGHRPFRATTTYAVIAEVIAAPIPSITDSVSGLAPALVEVIERCLTRDVDARIGTVDELVRLLGSALAEVGNVAVVAAVAPVSARADEAVSTSKWDATPVSVKTAPVAAVSASVHGASDVRITVPLDVAGEGTPVVVGGERAAAGPASSRGLSVAALALGACTAALLSALVLSAAWRRPPHDAAGTISGAVTVASAETSAVAASAPPSVPAATAVDTTASEPPPVASASAAPTLPPRLGKGEAMIVLDAPEATAVFLDGVAVGVAPIAPVVVPAGVHRVLFKHPTLGERVTVVDVKAGETNLADMQLGRDAGAGRAAHRVHPSGEKRLVLP